MRYIVKKNTSNDVQTALNNGTLGKPYVALVSGTTLDYNSLSASSQSIGEWNDVYGNHTQYTFTLNDSSPSLWENAVKIGTLNCWYAPESATIHGNIDIYLQYDSNWYFHFYTQGESPVEIDSFEEQGEAEHLSIREEEYGGSDWLPVKVSHDGDNPHIFTFYNDESQPMSLTTINPTE